MSASRRIKIVVFLFNYVYAGTRDIHPSCHLKRWHLEVQRRGLVPLESVLILSGRPSAAMLFSTEKDGQSGSAVVWALGREVV